MSLPQKVILPALGGKKPDNKLNRVVFPEPFGPIMPATWPSWRLKLTWLTATRPSKRLVKFWVLIRSDII